MNPKSDAANFQLAALTASRRAESRRGPLSGHRGKPRASSIVIWRAFTHGQAKESKSRWKVPPIGEAAEFEHAEPQAPAATSNQSLRG
jgi:hypothetical protein